MSGQGPTYIAKLNGNGISAVSIPAPIKATYISYSEYMNDFWNFFLTRLGWILFLALLFAYFFKQWYVLRRMRNWRATEGTVTEFAIRQEGNTRWPDIEYCYRVGEKDYCSHYFFADTTHNAPQSRYARKLAHKIAIAYKNDANITVYYNPASPDQAVLDTRIPSKLKVILSLLGGLILFECGLLMVQLVR